MKDSSEFNKILDKYINEDRINHAYLIETNVKDRKELAYLLINKILKLDSKNITIDNLYVNNDLYLVTTDTQTIKKEDIINLKNEFKNKSLYTGKRVYIIEEAEKLNSSSANTLLKFLEEPDEDIIAILLTNNVHKIIETILSRCQILRYYCKEELLVELPDNFENILSFVEEIEKYKEQMIAFECKYFDKDDFKDRKTVQDYLTNMLYIYYDILQKKVGLECLYCKDFDERVNSLANSLSFEDINDRVKAVNKAINKFDYNANTRLIIDSMIIDAMGGIKNV